MQGGVLITGGTGAFGQAFTRYLLGKHPDVTRIVIYSRNEFNQHLMAEALKSHANRLRFMIGDVRDRERLQRALRDIEFIVHAAALKRIQACRYNPDEAVKTNVIGSLAVAEAALASKVRKVILLSSDKAWRPVNLYGATKLAAEKLFLDANNMHGWDGPDFAVCRYGNIWNSTGSVVPLWRMKIASGERVEATDPDCTRFFMKLDEAIELVMHTFYTMKGGETNIPKLPAYRLGDLAEVMGARLKITGLPADEKLHEGMADDNTSDKARRMTKAELMTALDEAA